MFDTFDNVGRRDARRKAREQHIARMEEMSCPQLDLWEDEEPIAPSIGDARLHQGRNVAWLKRILSHQFCITLVCLISVMAAIAGFTLGLDVGERDQNVVTNSPEISEDSRYENLFSTILDWGVTPQDALEEEGSAQWHALQWLAYEDWETRNIEAVRTRYALAALYFSTHDVETATGSPRSWHVQTHWLSSYPVCLWHGVECHGEDNTMERVESLNLTSNGLAGTLPDELSLLQLDIHVLDVSENSIEGTIPASLSNLRNLQGLYLGPNYFHSTIPTAFMAFSHLTHLFINDCALIGTIPNEIGALTQMKVLGLHGNFLTGTIPNIEKLGNLYSLYLDDNLLRGQIPESIGAATGLVDLRLRRNQLEGTLPEALKHLSNLEILYLDSNEFTGFLPSSVLRSLLLLQELYLYDNHLNGTIPEEIGSAVLMHTIYLDGNDFSGPLPLSFGYLRHLESLYLFGNKLKGTIPANFGWIGNLRSLRLNANNLTGSLPSELGSLDKLETLFLNDNVLTGTIPSLGGMRALNKLTLHGNSFQGTVPPSLCSLTSGNLKDLTADCEGTALVCTCCSLCY